MDALVRIVFEISGDRQIERDLLRLGDRAGDVSPAFDRIVDLWADETARQFDTEGQHGSGGWQPLSESYAAWKARHYPGRRILERSFALEDSLTNRGDPNMIVQIAPQELAWGTRIAYAGAHQNPSPGSRLPRRRPVEFTEAARRATVKVLQRFVLTGEVGP